MESSQRDAGVQLRNVSSRAGFEEDVDARKKIVYRNSEDTDFMQKHAEWRTGM